MDFIDTEHVPRLGIPNRYYNYTHYFAKNRRDLTSNASGVKQLIKTHGSVAAMHKAGGAEYDRLKEQFMAMRRAAREQQQPVNVMPPPPKPTALYHRVDTGTIVDVGSGDGHKLLANTSHLKVIATDVEQQRNPVIRKLESLHAIELAPVVTSYMVMTQLSQDVCNTILEKDGLHILPDIDWLDIHGFAKEENGRYVSKGLSREYTDNKIVVPSFKISPGYMATNGYHLRSVSVQTGAALQPPRRPNEPMPYLDTYTQDSTPKWDGINKLLVINCIGGRLKGLVQGRNNQAFSLSLVDVVGPDFSVILSYEEMLDPYPHRLIRVVKFNGYRPYHSAALLDHFTNRIRIMIDDKRIVGPGYVDTGEPTDGRIIRIGEVDYRYKDKRTFDLTYTSVKAIEKLINLKGIIMEPVLEFCGLMEFEVFFGEPGVVTFKYVRLRDDKDKADTTKDVVKHILGQD